MKRAISFLFAALLVVALGTTAMAANFYSIATGNWRAPATWSATSGGAAGTTIPKAGDAVTIEGGHNVTVDSNAACATVTFTTATATSLTLGAYTLTVSGTITIPRCGTGVNLIAVGAGTLSADSIAFTSGGTGVRHQITISTGTVDVSTSVTTDNIGVSASITFTGAGFLRVGGSLLTAPTVGGTLTTVAGSTVEYNGAAQTVKNVTYTGNLTLSGSGAKTLGTTTTTIGGNLTLSGTATTALVVGLAVSGNLNIGDGTTLTAGAFTLGVTGTTTVGSGSGSTATLAISSATGTKTFTGAVTINSNGAITESAPCTLSFGSDVTIGGTLTENGASTVGIAGSLTNNGTYTASTGVHTFSGTGKTIGGTKAVAIPSLTISGTTTNSSTLTVSTTLAGASTLTNSDTLNLGGTCSVTTLTNNGTITSSGTGTTTSTTVTNNLTFNMGSTGTVTAFTNAATGVLNVTATPTVATITTLTVSAVGNTVNYTGAGAQTVRTGTTFYNLGLSGSGAKTMTGVTTITNNFSMSGGATATTVITTIGGTVAISGTAVMTTGANLAITGNLTIGSGSGLTTGATFTLGVTGTTSVTGTFTLAGTGTKTFTGDVTLNSGAVWNETGIAAYSFGGSLSNAASTFTANAGVHTFSGTSKTLSGSTTTSIGSVTVSGTYTNNGTLTVGTALAGASGTLANSSTLNIGGSCSIGSTSGGLSNSGTVAVTGSGNITTLLAGFTNTGTINLGGSGTIAGITNNAAGIVNLSSSGTITNFNNATATSKLNISAATVPTITTLTATTVGNTVNYTGAAQTACKVTTYDNLTLSGSGAKTFATTPTVNNVLSLEGTASVVVTTGVVTYGTSATLQYNKPALYTATTEEWITPFVATGGIIIENAGPITTPGAVQVGNNTSVPLNIKSGATLTPGTSLLTLEGDFINAGTLTSGSGGVTITGTVATQNIGSITTTGTVTCSKSSGTATLTGNMSAGPLTVNTAGGTLNLGTGLTHGCTNLTFTAGTLNCGSSTLSISGTVTTGGTFAAGTSTIKYTGTTQTIAALSYYNLDLSGATTPAALSGSYTIAGVFTPKSTTSPAQGTSTIAFAGTSQTIPAFTYNNLTISGSTTPVLVNGGTITIAGAFTPGGVVPTVAGNTVAFTGTSQTIPAFTYNNLNLSGSTTPAALSGSYTIMGTFTPKSTTSPAQGTSTISFTGASQTIPAFTYNNLTLSGSGTATVGGSINVGGNLNNSVTLDMAGNTLAVTGSTTNTGGTFRFSGAANGLAISSGTVEYYGSGQTVASGTYATLNLSAASTYTAGGTLNTTTLYVGGNPSTLAAVLDMGGNTLTWTSIDNSSGTIRFSGSNGQAINSGTIEYYGSGQTVASGQYNNLTINQSSGDAVITSGFAAVTGKVISSKGKFKPSISAGNEVFNNLTFLKGNLRIGDHNLTLGGSVTGAAAGQCIVTDGIGVVSYYVGNGGSFTFPIGPSTTTYNPVLITNNDASSHAYTARVEVGENPATGDDSKACKRTWTLSGDASGGVNLTFSWSSSDAGSNLNGNEINGTVWTLISGAWVDQLGTTSGTPPNNTTQVTGITALSAWTVGLTGALPIELASFVASTDGNNVKLEWSTVSETNTHGYYVERRNGNTGTFATVSGFIQGAGTSLALHNYTWTDTKVNSGTYNYRLRQVDMTGGVTYSSVITVNVAASVLGVREEGGIPTQFKLQQNFPNPFNPTTDIKFWIKDAGMTTLKVYNALGQEIARLVSEPMQPGRYAITWDASAMPSGVYFYRLSNGTNVSVQRMLLLK